MDISRILAQRILPVATLPDARDAVHVAEALLAGGIGSLEILFRHPAAEQALAAIIRECPDLLVGAGTLLDREQVKRAQGAGAYFGVAPGLSRDVLRAAAELGLPFVPGVMTPTEVESALAEGCRVLKFFPASLAGGVPMLSALAGPYGHTGVKFVVLHGIRPENMGEYLDLPIVGAVGGSWIVAPDVIAAKDWRAITRRAKEAVALVVSRAGA